MMKSLKTKILLSMVSIFLVGMWSLSFYISMILERDMVQLMGDQQFSTVSIVAANVDRELSERLTNLKTIASKITPELLADTPALQFLLADRPIFQEHFNGGTFVIGKDGIATASIPLSLERKGISYIDRDYVIRALQHDEVTISPVVVEKKLNTPVFTMAAPIHDKQGAVIGAIVGVIDLGQPNFLDKITSSQYGKSGGYLLIDAKARRVITATDKTRIMEQLPKPGVNLAIDRFLNGYEGHARMRNPAGIEMLAADIGIPVTGWIVAFVLPAEEALAPVHTMQLQLMLGSTLFTLLAAGFIWWILRHHFHSLLRTAAAISDMAQPNTPLYHLPPVQEKETGELVSGYNRLVTAIEQRDRLLIDSHQTLQKILQTTLDGYWRTSKQGKLLEVNLAYCTMSGYTEQELLSMSIADLESQEQSGETLLHIDRIIEAGHDQFESTHKRKDGSKWFVEISTIYDQNNDGQFIAFIRDISERRISADKLEKNERRLSAILEGAADAIFITDHKGRYQYINQAAVDMLGYSREEMLAKNIGDISHPEEASRAEAQFEDMLSTGGLRADYWLKKKSGESIAVALNATVLPDGNVFGSCRDITERKKTEEKLQLAASVFTHAREGIMITEADGSIIEVNDTFTRITGYSREEVLGKNPRILNSGRQDKAFYAELWRGLEREGYWSGEVWNRRKNGEVFAEMQTISVVRDAYGKTQSYVALFSDITSIKENQRKLERMAHFDALTNLPNRVLLADRLHQSMAAAQRRQQQLAVAFLDLDGFKLVNDHYGHEMGDHLLIALSDKFKHVLRDGDTLARIGGDEFVMVLVDLDAVADCVPVLNRLLAVAAQEIEVDSALLQVSASVGVTFYPQTDDIDSEHLIRQADQAMYHAKQAGKNCYHIFDADQDRSMRSHHADLLEIHEALDRQEFVLYYQPKVDMRKGIVIGVEALIRWQHPTRGLLAPAVFLPLIEEDPLAIELGEWVINTALTQIEEWHAVGLAIPVSVNVGALQLQQGQFLQRLRDMMAKAPKVRPGDLELELLETSALQDLSLVARIIEECKDVGINFALDDFGTGYSSLTYLKRLSVSMLKMDQGFVRDMLDDPDDLAILIGVIGLSEAFRCEVIAEGVETVAHGELLLRLGCDLAQGYGIARPMPAHAFPAWREMWQPDPSWHDVPRISREDLPMLVARVELRAWLLAMEQYIKNERKVPPSLDHESCAFGVWLAGHGLNFYGAQPRFLELIHQHRLLHGLAAQLYEFKIQDKDDAALAGLTELHALASTLLVPLDGLIHSNWYRSVI